ncbi:MAG TPA: TonB family protein [Candidatus Aminicenantes bacterium]|nr:TonB family protein [Candidatus Aminicenantes bacterium]
MKKILVIDYDQNSLASLQGTLAKEGYEVVTATDGQAGWDRYNKESPDLVLMEAMLPKVHGFELCQRITSERNSQATVFIMTGVYKDRVYRTEALRTYGASEYFEKPLKVAELLSSIEAVLGKPEPRQEPERARPVRPEPVTADASKRDKPRSDEDLFSIPADIDKLAREIPKLRKSAPAPARRETPAEARFESLADDLLKTVAARPVPEAKRPAERTGGGNGNGSESADIDQFLKSALAGFEIEKDKVKAPRPAPRPPAPAPPPPAPEAEKPAAAKPAAERPKPAPAPAPESGPAVPGPAARNTLTPGDPGSDISPFFTPAKPKPQAPPDPPKAQAPARPVMPAAPVKPARPAETPRPEPARREPRGAEPARPEPAMREPVRTEVKIPEVSPTPSGDIFQHREIFEHIGEGKEKKGLPKLVFAAVGVVAVAAAAFLVLRPKPAPRPVPVPSASRAVPAIEVPAPPPVETLPPVVEPAPAKPKPKPAAKAAEAPPVAEGIVDPVVPAGVLALTPPASERDGNAAAAKAEAQPPAARTEAEPPAAVASPPAAPPVKEGDLVDLGSVTSPPALTKKVNPVYPQGAQARGLEGSITVNALIDEKGNVVDTGILKGIQDDMGLGKAAEAAVRKWKFEPARKDGVAVKVWKPFVIAFKAEKSDSGASE